MQDIAQQLIEWVNADQNERVLDQLYSEQIISMEPRRDGQAGDVCRGIEQVRRKHEFWNGENEVHHTRASGPFCGPRDNQFMVLFDIELTPKGGALMNMREMGLYTVADGKIVEEAFFSYDQPLKSDRQLDYLELPGEDFAALQQFYVQVFAWRFTPYGSEYLAFTDGHMDGGFYRSPNRSDTTSGAALAVFYSSDLETLQSRVAESGGEVCRPIFSFPGGRRFHFKDPHGNELAAWSDVGLS